MIDMNQVVGQNDIVLLSFDTLRYDVAVQSLKQGKTPHLKALLSNGWEKRHSPGNFTYAAHQAFFAGFLPTPAKPGKHQRLFASEFTGSETSSARTCVFRSADIVTGLAEKGYHSICIGGVGFFNKQTPLSCVLPSFFDESYWEPGFGVTDPRSAENQFCFAARRLAGISRTRKIFLFINISAIHQPNHFYVPGSETDSLITHTAAFQYVDKKLPILVQALQKRGKSFWIFTSDHGTAYGEDGYYGHRSGHDVIWTVPYAHTFVPYSKHGANHNAA